jgi:branched-chain amino acid transport system substrate-binding protein
MTRQARIAIGIVPIVLVAAILILSSPDNQPDTITIGAVLPLSGKSAQYGKWIQEGLELGKDHINAQGGIRGKTLVIIYEDDAAIPKDAANAMQKLVSIHQVPVVYGSWASSCVLAQAPIAQQSHTVLIGEAISPKIRNAGDYVFRMQPDARYYLRKLVPFVYQQMRVASISILYVNNDFGLDQANVFEDAFTNLGGRVLHSEGYSQKASDFRTQLLKIQNYAPDAVFVPGYAELGLILKQAREMGLRQRFIGSVPSENPDVIETAGEAAEGLIYPHHFDPESQDALVRNYQEAYKTRYGRSSEGFAALAYDGIRIVAKVMDDQGELPDRIKEGLNTLADFPGVTGPTTFDDHGDVIKTIIIKTIRDGQFTVYEGE